MSPENGAPSTRERILNYLKDNRVVSVEILSRSWGLTRADIRYHIHQLLDEKIIETIPRDPAFPVKRGRPPVQYRLAPGTAAHNLPVLASSLLDLLLNPLPPEEREARLRDLAVRLAGSHIPVANPTRRMNQAIEFLNKHGYQARWEAHQTGPQIIFHNCPYASVLETHPELCLLDRFLLEYLTQNKFDQITHMDMIGTKHNTCVFSNHR